MRLITYTGHSCASLVRGEGASTHPSGGRGSGAEGAWTQWAQEVAGGEGSTGRAATRARQAVPAEGPSQMGQRQAVGSASVHGELASVWHGATD